MKERTRRSRATSLRSPTALVLTGGGAHGAYEAGVLPFLFEAMPPKSGRQSLFDLFTGTSAGALNACTLASMAHDPQQGIRALSGSWNSITMNRLLRFGPRELARLPGVLMGRKVGFDFLQVHTRPPRPASTGGGCVRYHASP